MLAAELLSGLAERTVLFTAMLFLIVAGSTGLVSLRPEDLLIVRLAELALSNLGLASAVRALLFGLPLTLVLTALHTRFVAGLSWPEAFLLGVSFVPLSAGYSSRERPKRRVGVAHSVPSVKGCAFPRIPYLPVEE